MDPPQRPRQVEARRRTVRATEVDAKRAAVSDQAAVPGLREEARPPADRRLPRPGLLLGRRREPPEGTWVEGEAPGCDRVLRTAEPGIRPDAALRSVARRCRPSRLQLRHVVRLLPDRVRAPRPVH